MKDIFQIQIGNEILKGAVMLPALNIVAILSNWHFYPLKGRPAEALTWSSRIYLNNPSA